MSISLGMLPEDNGIAELRTLVVHFVTRKGMYNLYYKRRPNLS